MDIYPCPPAGFETAIPASERTQTYALDRAAPGTGLRMTSQSTIHNKACLEDAKRRLDYENLNIKVFVEPERKYVVNTKESCMSSEKKINYSCQNADG